jgi:hypothetical protein
MHRSFTGAFSDFGGRNVTDKKNVKTCKLYKQQNFITDTKSGQHSETLTETTEYQEEH